MMAHVREREARGTVNEFSKIVSKIRCVPMFIFSEVSDHYKGGVHNMISKLNCMLFNASCYVTDFVCVNTVFPLSGGEFSSMTIV